jgi:hypothetical protein
MKKLVTRTYHHKQGIDIALPLAEPKGLRKLRCTHVRALKREIGRALSAGYEVIDPITGKRIKIYRRGLHRSQIWTLRRLRDRSDKLRQTYIPLEVFSGRRDGDLAKLELWGLAKRLRTSARYDAEKTRGMWMITKEGRQFLDGRRGIKPQVAVLLGERVCMLGDRTITVTEITGDFDRKKLEDGTDGKDVA